MKPKIKPKALQEIMNKLDSRPISIKHNRTGPRIGDGLYYRESKTLKRAGEGKGKNNGLSIDHNPPNAQPIFSFPKFGSNSSRPPDLLEASTSGQTKSCPSSKIGGNLQETREEVSKGIPDVPPEKDDDQMEDRLDLARGGSDYPKNTHP